LIGQLISDGEHDPADSRVLDDIRNHDAGDGEPQRANYVLGHIVCEGPDPGGLHDLHLEGPGFVLACAASHKMRAYSKQLCAKVLDLGGRVKQPQKRWEGTLPTGKASLHTCNL